MTLVEFRKQIKNHKTLVLANVIEGGETDWIVVKRRDKDEGFMITAPSIEKNSWKDLEPLLLGKIEPWGMIQITRVVGYYSRTNNWNASKLEELKDRQKGNYVFPEVN